MAKRLVQVEAQTLRKLLEWVNGVSQAHHGRYDRKTKTYPWNDKIFAESDPYRFALYKELRAALRRRSR